MFEVKNDDSLKDYAMSLVYCKPVPIPNRYSYFSFGSRKTGAAMVEQALSFYMNHLYQSHNNPESQDFQKAASLIYYKSTRAYCFMQLQSCMVRANVWKNMLACVFNNSKTERTNNSLGYGAPYYSTDNYTVHLSSDNYDNYDIHNNHNSDDNYNNHNSYDNYNNHNSYDNYNNHHYNNHHYYNQGS
ncbi:unnamed protein product [Nippostrongylus brasiliensis]|uniref:Ground-like domain-containing protein n=1 Tax=Nippostrongylus brasiliensis TaxID=27835 RepID=A0A0N4YUH5_NIPBR|nr:unnamed protein product [Nippostrongylus brasiliensis]